ncbi:hypothetical protein CEXT_268031 [Caerostris extrusa]|uniref:Uncharacterized protein n=1 Tax=Caerostris extrusa TaxID=172846 RepID=A0AAV4VM73_CAEEX|nr:hypothetical protein CEXT_268031 [Caerostris extrusa]
MVGHHCCFVHQHSWWSRSNGPGGPGENKIQSSGGWLQPLQFVADHSMTGPWVMWSTHPGKQYHPKGSVWPVAGESPLGPSCPRRPVTTWPYEWS